MPDDRQLPADAKLSEQDVRRVLERAIQIDGDQTEVAVSELAVAAHEAGISEKAMLQAVRELLRDRQVVSAVDPGITTSGEPRVGSAPWLRTAAFGFLLVIVLMAIFFFLRMFP